MRGDCVLSALTGIGSFRRRPRVYHVEGNVAVGKSECAQLVAESIRAKGAKVVVVEENVDARSDTDASSNASSNADDRILDTSLVVLEECLRRHARASRARDEGFDVILVVRHPTTTLTVFDPPERVVSLFERVGESIPDFLSTPENTIYIKNSARSCRERATRRGRDDERHLDEAAFETWHERLEDMMREREASGGCVYTFDTFGADSSQVVPAIIGCLGF